MSEDLKKQTILVMHEVRKLADMLGIPNKTMTQKVIKKRQPTRIDSEAFVSFWSIYPHYPGRSIKKTAFSSFKTHIKTIDQEANLLLAVNHYKKAILSSKDGNGFVPAAHRWIRDGIWEIWVKGNPETVAKNDMNKERARIRREEQKPVRPEEPVERVDIDTMRKGLADIFKMTNNE